MSSLLKGYWLRYKCSPYVRLLSSRVLEQPVSSNGPWQVYSEKVANGLLTKDEHQEIVVHRLQQIYKEISSFDRSVLDNQTRGTLFSFFRKSQPPKIIAPKGLYIWGSVGGGKTMLMDLFYETVPVCAFNGCFNFYTIYTCLSGLTKTLATHSHYTFELILKFSL